MAHLYELSEQYRSVIANLESEEITEDLLKAKLAEVTTQLNDKAESIGKLVMELEADNTAIETEINRLANRKRITQNKIDWLKSYVLSEMLASGIEKIPGQILTISIQKNPPSCNIIDTSLLPLEYIRIIPEQKQADKVKILANFKATGEIPAGAEIITDKKSLRIK